MCMSGVAVIKSILTCWQYFRRTVMQVGMIKVSCNQGHSIRVGSPKIENFAIIYSCRFKRVWLSFFLWNITEDILRNAPVLFSPTQWKSIVTNIQQNIFFCVLQVCILTKTFLFYSEPTDLITYMTLNKNPEEMLLFNSEIPYWNNKIRKPGA